MLGCGPSLTREQVEACRGKAKVIAVKEAARLAPWADALYFCDAHFVTDEPDLFKNFKGRVLTLENYKLREKLPKLECLKNDGPKGFADEPDRIRHGKNSGYQAMHVAAHLGARRIVMLGFDMKPGDGGRLHFFGNRATRTTPPSVYSTFMVPKFPEFAVELKRRAIDVVNATPGSAIGCFRRAPIQEALA